MDSDSKDMDLQFYDRDLKRRSGKERKASSINKGSCLESELGTGLGLTITRQLARLIGGMLRCKAR
jgi:signal transduction histidine kinase